MTLPGSIVAAAERITAATTTLDAIHATLTREVDQIANDPRYSDEYRAEQIAAAQERARAATADAEGIASRAHESVAGFTPDPLGPTDPVLRELQLGRAWERAKGMLDGGLVPAEVLAQVESDRDPMMLAALAEQGPAWLMSNSDLSRDEREVAVEHLRRGIDVTAARAFPKTSAGAFAALRLRADANADHVRALVARNALAAAGRPQGFAEAVHFDYTKDALQRLDRDLAKV